jgi:hypothetical protein
MLRRHKKEIINEGTKDENVLYTPLTDAEEIAATESNKRHHTIFNNGVAIHFLYSDEEEAVRDVEEAEFQSKEKERAAYAIRKKRDAKLTESDWTQVADAPVAQAAWATYRQALRDIPTHANFPNLKETDWPTKPE